VVHAWHRIAAAALIAAGCSSSGEERRGLSFVVVPDAEARIEVELDSPLAARADLMEALDELSGAPSLAGRGRWETVAVVPPGGSAADSVAAGRTYVRRGAPGLRLDVRLGAGDRGAFAGGVARTSALRAMVQVQLSDEEPDSRFRIRLVRDDAPEGEPPIDATPRHLGVPLPRGLYRAPVDVPEAGTRFLVGVTVLDRHGNATGHAWASPIAVERPWLAEPAVP
jgi:hypothetical protein